MRNRAGSFSVGRLIEFLTTLGRDVEARRLQFRFETLARRLVLGLKLYF